MRHTSRQGAGGASRGGRAAGLARATSPGAGIASGSAGSWTFLSNHAHVLLCLAADPDVRVRDVAGLVGITDRAVLRILAELEAAGYIAKAREGRRNRYSVRPGMPLRHPIEKHRTISALLALLDPEPGGRARRRRG